MKLISRNNQNLNLSNIYGVTDVWCSFTGNEITIHLSSLEGNEQIIINHLPSWVRDEMEVHKSCGHVFLQAKQS